MSNHFYPQKFYFQKFHFFKILSHLILFYFINLFFFRKIFVMNSVHEQCPISDLEIVPSQKTGSKLSQVHKAPNLAQPAHTSAPRRARAAILWRPHRRVAPCAAWPPGRITGQAAVSWACASAGTAVSWPALRYSCLPQAPPGHNTSHCIAIQFPTAQLLLLTIQFMYYDTMPTAFKPASVTIH